MFFLGIEVTGSEVQDRITRNSFVSVFVEVSLKEGKIPSSHFCIKARWGVVVGSMKNWLFCCFKMTEKIQNLTSNYGNCQELKKHWNFSDELKNKQNWVKHAIEHLTLMRCDFDTMQLRLFIEKTFQEVHLTK